MYYKLRLNDILTIERANGNCSSDSFFVFLSCINFFIAAPASGTTKGHIKVHFYASVLFIAVRDISTHLKYFFSAPPPPPLPYAPIARHIKRGKQCARLKVAPTAGSIRMYVTLYPV